MSAKTSLTELELLRRSRDWSYQQLADEIARTTNRRRDQDCWRKICQGLTPNPQSTTQDILDEYLASLEDRPSRRRVS